MPYAPLEKGTKMPRVKRIPVSAWGPDRTFTLTVKVNKEPRLSASKRCYMFAFEHGETDIEVEIGGKKRKVRMTFILYAKVPATERNETLEAEAQRLEARGDPQLY